MMVYTYSKCIEIVGRSLAIYRSWGKGVGVGVSDPLLNTHIMLKLHGLNWNVIAWEFLLYFKILSYRSIHLYFANLYVTNI